MTMAPSDQPSAAVRTSGDAFQLITPMRPVNVIGIGEEIAGHGVVAADVCFAQGDLRCAIGRGAATDDDGSNRPACDPSGEIDRGRAGKEVAGAGEAEARGVEEVR